MSRAELAGALDAFARAEGPDKARSYAAVVAAVFARWPDFRATPQGIELERRRRTILALEALRAAVRGARRLFVSPGGAS